MKLDLIDGLTDRTGWRRLKFVLRPLAFYRIIHGIVMRQLSATSRPSLERN